jgi:hypothetical protein
MGERCDSRCEVRRKRRHTKVFRHDVVLGVSVYCRGESKGFTTFPRSFYFSAVVQIIVSVYFGSLNNSSQQQELIMLSRLIACAVDDQLAFAIV